MRTVLVGLIAATAFAQTANSISGTVLNDRSGLPLRRAHVLLTPAATGLTAVGVDTADNGTFNIRDVEPGRYSLSASRDGYLASTVCTMGTVRLAQVFSIGSKESISNLTFRLRPFAVMAGRVSLEDGEPAMNVRVEAFREHRDHLQHGYILVATATTNDRGEYRMFGLHPGSYLVAATMERSVAYATTFYLNATKLGDAVMVRLDYGQEIGGIDMFLDAVPKVKVRGRVISGSSGAAITATIALQRLDAHNTASIAVPVQAVFDRNNQFEIRDVTPGPYIIWAEAADGEKVLSAHVPLMVGAADIDDVALTVEGQREGRAVLVMEDGVKLEASLHLRFEPRNERAKVITVAESASAGGFHFALMASEVYDLFVAGLPNDFYVSAVKVNGVDLMAQGIDGSAASADRAFEVALDSHGGVVSGRVLGDGDALWSRASVALIPDPPKGRVQSYREGAADENGVFALHGVAPGKYILIAWLDDAPCEYYDPEALAACRAAGMSVNVEEAGQQNVELKMKAGARR